MKKIVFVVALVVAFSSFVNSQDMDRTRMRAQDRFIITPMTDFWSGLPQGMNTYVINRGITLDYIQEYPISTSNFSIAAGLGFSGHNLYSDHRYLHINDRHLFVAIPSNQDYRNNKLSLNYINVPLEFRYRTRNTPRTFRIHAGLRGGLLVSGHTKYVGETAPGERKTKVKEKMLDNIEPFLLGAYGRIGYGRFNLYTFTNLTDIFTGNNAEGASVTTVGISFIVF